MEALDKYTHTFKVCPGDHTFICNTIMCPGECLIIELKRKTAGNFLSKVPHINSEDSIGE